VTVPGPQAIWLSLGLLGGPALFDDHLADYRWSVTPRPSWGVQAMAGRGPWSTGVRLTRTGTTQLLGIPDPSSAARVNATGLEWVGQARFATVAGFELMAAASGGRLHLGYDPDRVEFTPGGSGTPVTVELSPVDNWIGGAGFGARRPLAGRWTAALSIERRIFSMETAHRDGGAIVVERERFGDWNARVELARRFGRG